jgi:hypothetical protein
LEPAGEIPDEVRDFRAVGEPRDVYPSHAVLESKMECRISSFWTAGNACNRDFSTVTVFQTGVSAIRPTFRRGTESIDTEDVASGRWKISPA